MLLIVLRGFFMVGNSDIQSLFSSCFSPFLPDSCNNYANETLGRERGDPRQRGLSDQEGKREQLRKEGGSSPLKKRSGKNIFLYNIKATSGAS